MQVTAIKTHKITTKDKSIFDILDRYITCHSGEQTATPDSLKGKSRKDPGQARMTILEEHSVLAVTSKIISFTQNRVVPAGSADKQQLIEQEAEYYLPRSSSKYDVQFTITNNILSANAGVDESNADGNLVLWPENPQKAANDIREHIVSTFNLHHIGVIITDSKATPLRWGVTGISLAHSGFNALKDYIGTQDLFGRAFHFEKLNIADSLAAVAVLAMGEGAEQTPMALITDIPMVAFQDRNPTEEELQSLHIDLQDDLYAPLLTSVKWEKGKRRF